MNAIPVQDSKGNVTGVSNLDGDDLISALISQAGHNKSFVKPTMQESAELSRWLRENYSTGVSNRRLARVKNQASKLREHTKVLQNYKNRNILPNINLSNVKKIPLLGGGLLGLLASAPMMVEGGRNLMDYLLGLNDTEIWKNPDRYGYGESHDPYMDPNHPAYDLQVPIEDMVKSIPYSRK